MFMYSWKCFNDRLAVTKGNLKQTEQTRGVAGNTVGKQMVKLARFVWL